MDNLEWMDDETKIAARKKLEKMEQYIAYPNEVFNQTVVEEYFKDLTISRQTDPSQTFRFEL